MSYEDELVMLLRNGEFKNMYEIVFDILKKVSGKLDEAENFRRVFSPYLLCRYLSMIPRLIGYAELLNAVNSQETLTPQQFYQLAYRIVPKQSSGYVEYIRKVKVENATTINNVNETAGTETKTSLFDL